MRVNKDLVKPGQYRNLYFALHKELPTMRKILFSRLEEAQTSIKDGDVVALVRNFPLRSMENAEMESSDHVFWNIVPDVTFLSYYDLEPDSNFVNTLYTNGSEIFTYEEGADEESDRDTPEEAISDISSLESRGFYILTQDVLGTVLSTPLTRVIGDTEIFITTLEDYLNFLQDIGLFL